MNETTPSKRAIASRANGAKSKGPITEEGKRRSSQNAIRHGLLADCIVLNHEDKNLFQQLLDQHILKFNPADDVEHEAIEEMAAARWRIRRLWSIETHLMNHCMDNVAQPDGLNLIAAAFSELATNKQFDRLDRYEARLSRMYQRAHHTLRLLQSMHPEPEPDAPNAPNPDKSPDLPNAHQPDTPATEAAPEIPGEQNEPNAVPVANALPIEIAPQPNEPGSPAAGKPERDPSIAGIPPHNIVKFALINSPIIRIP